MQISGYGTEAAKLMQSQWRSVLDARIKQSRGPGAADEAASASASAKPAAGAAAGASSVGGMFSEMLSQVISSDKAAIKAADSYAAGKTHNIHETMVAMTKADINLSLLVSVRNKLLEAYREVSRMS